MSEEQKSRIAKREEEILQFWQEKNIFQKSLDKPSPKGEFVFYDGPPFATGLPHYGHLLPGTVKDVIPRFKTMQGHHVRRVWGWDCHGLPIENLIQKELGVATKKEIEEYGVERFNEAARSSVFRYEDEWKKIVPRTGRWVDMDQPYTTMDQSYTESVWWGFKEMHKKGLVYEDFKSMHVSPPLETPLSNFEVNQNYKDIEDISVYAKFELEDDPGTYFVAWTTTPWTLPGNVALAVGPDITYVKAKKHGEYYVVAKELAEKILKEEYEVVESFAGSSLVGKQYTPVFDYYIEEELEHKENAWRVYAGDFVTTEDGTGVVHIAPAFGEDDLALAKDNDLPFIQHVAIDGTIKEEVKDLAGRQAKPKATEEEPKKHQETDIEVLKLLAHKGLLFAKEKYTHSYPHCWRTDAPLLNYAMSSWFIKVTDIKDSLVSENKKVNWTPEDIRDGRFGKWLEGARDWAVSRNRFWGAPMPIWQSEDGQDVEVIGSIEELQGKVPEQIQDMYVMRHGESEKNVQGIYSNRTDGYPLTEKGTQQTQEAVKNLKGAIDMVITSPVLRAKQTAEIVAEHLDVELKEAQEMTEVDSGAWDEKKVDEVSGKDVYESLSDEEYYTAKRGETGESWEDVEKRAYQFVSKTLQENPGKRILFVTHGGVIFFLIKALRRMSISRARTMLEDVHKGGYAEPQNIKVDRNTLREFDFHRPYIDAFTWKNTKGNTMTRVPYVFDTWIDSGSMPFAQMHYPFENKEKFLSEHYPADFIAESLDQTRGWFYTLLVQGIGLFKEAPYKNVAVTGLILAEDGRKMSKSLNNYPEVTEVLNKYGADAMRYYLMSSPAVKAEQLAFSEKGVDEVVKKVILRLKNVQSFFEMYKDTSKVKSQKSNIQRPESKNILDIWMLARLDELIKEVTESLDAYELDKATRPFADFVDDLSTWYLRRSRDRFKATQSKTNTPTEGSEEDDVLDKEQAIKTLGFVLRETSKLLAPFMPFLAEDLYQSLRNDGDVESVHLEAWPYKEKGFWASLLPSQDESDDILVAMSEIRTLISEALELRAREGVKVRQPLASLTVTKQYPEELLELIRDEVNVKDVVVGEEIALDFELTDVLREEGAARDIVRGIQDMRKKAKLVPEDEIVLTVTGDTQAIGVFESYREMISGHVRASRVIFDTTEGEAITTEFGDLIVSISK